MSNHEPRNGGRIEITIEAIILLAVAGMAGCASFTHVHDWTMHNSPAGTGDWFGWANAMVSELIPLAAGLEARRRRRLFGKAGAYPITLIVAAAALSLSGQLAEATPSPSGWLISAVPALGFLALVKLVLSSPTHTATRLSSDNAHQTRDASKETEATPPVLAMAAIEPVPAHLLASARFAATHHEQTTGQPLEPGDLAARISIPRHMAVRVLDTLAQEATAHINGHQPNPAVGL